MGERMNTEKMLPAGFVPGKDETAAYALLYADPAFTLAARIASIELSMLTEDAVRAICKRNSFETGVGIEDPARLEPVDKRCFHAQRGLEYGLSELHAREIRFRDAITSKESDIPAAYKALRTTFITVVGQKVALEYVKRQLENTTPEEIRQQNRDYEAREKAWRDKLASRKKIYAIAEEHPGFVDDMQFDEAYYIEKYDLTDADLKELELMLEEEREEARKRANIPYNHIERYDWFKGYYSVPIIAEKIKMIRKETKLNQRDFARLIGYPNVNRYAKFEKGEDGTPRGHEKYELIKAVCDATSANPYWLEEDREETIYDVDEENTAKTIAEADPLYNPPMYATNKVIREWWVTYMQRKIDIAKNGG